jgi:hypothetical protein
MSSSYLEKVAKTSADAAGFIHVNAKCMASKNPAEQDRSACRIYSLLG